MMHYQRFILLLFMLCFGSFTRLFAQTLSFDDILKLYSLDSSAARQFCTGKKWEVTTAGNTGATRRYRYTTADSSSRLEIGYPNDAASPNVQLNYWFGSAKDYNRFKKAFRKSGFMKQSTKEISGALSSYSERYVRNNLQIELIHPEGKQPYWLFLHPVGNYSW